MSTKVFCRNCNREILLDTRTPWDVRPSWVHAHSGVAECHRPSIALPPEP